MQSRSSSSSSSSAGSRSGSSRAKRAEFFVDLDLLDNLERAAKKRSSAVDRQPKKRMTVVFEDSLFDRRCQIAAKYMNTPTVKNTREYIEIWFLLIDELERPEEAFVYMYSYEIGVSDIEFYRRWMSHYTSRHEFILAFQVFELFKEMSARNKADLLHDIQELERMLEAEEIGALVNDFYSQEFYQGNIMEEKRKKYGDIEVEGISHADFEKIKEIDLGKRISTILASIYCMPTNDGSNSKTESGSVCRKSKALRS
jgi:hypothetical protein